MSALGRFVSTILACAVLCVPAALMRALAQDYPTKPITILVPQAPGASSDLLARTLAERLQALWGQSVVIDNRPGAGSNLGAAIAARAAPDGYTLMIGTDALMTSNVHLYKSMPFDPIKDFAPVAMAGANIIVSRGARERAGEDHAGADRLREGQSRQAASTARRGLPRRTICRASCSP